MKKYSWIFMFTLSIAWGQTDPQAAALLEKVAQKIEGYQTVSFDFSYALENTEEQIRQESSGKVWLEGNKYRLEFLGLIQLFDTEKLYTIVPENEEITISEPSEEEEGFNPSKLLYFYQEGYGYQMDIVQNVMGRKIQFIRLNPTEEDTDIDYLLLGIDVNSLDIYRLIEIGSNGTRTTLTLLEQSENKSFPPSTFVFDEADYPGYYID